MTKINGVGHLGSARRHIAFYIKCPTHFINTNKDLRWYAKRAAHL